ncbi:MAG: hypothetical protein AABX12_04680 [Nanoarchaeota archaeon]
MRINSGFYRIGTILIPYRIENNQFVVMDAPRMLASECKSFFGQPAAC